MVKLKLLIGKERIASKISEIAAEINHDYREKDLVIVMVLKGAICFAADLIREITLPTDLQTVQCSSYGALGVNRGELKIFGLDSLDITNRDVLLLDDIFDSGHTLSALQEALWKKKPRSLKTLVLLSRPAPHLNEIRPDRSGFSIGSEFVVGYGLDYKERYRGLPGIHILEEE